VAQLLARLHHEGVNTTGLWERVTASVVRVVQLVLQDVVSQLSQESASSPCYKIFGADVLVTKDLQPHVLEVNRSPDMSVSATTSLEEDVAVKGKMVNDMAEVLTNQGRQLSIGNGFRKVLIH